jgi:DNA (cytosine-5)-methyltransferase 1
MNYGRTAEVYQMTAEDVYHSDSCNHVDHLHLSCPCQYFSPAHTHDGKNDDDNIAALFITELMLEKCKPRMHTQEQTIGIVQRHPAFFAALINMIVSAGYNVRWRCVNFLDDGVSQNRKRVIIFASL